MTTTRYTHWREQGQIILKIASVLERCEEKRWEHDEHADHQHTQECVQADAALDVASSGWLWEGICKANTIADLSEIASAVEERGDSERNDGCGDAAEVWYHVAETIRHLTE